MCCVVLCPDPEFVRINTQSLSSFPIAYSIPVHEKSGVGLLGAGFRFVLLRWVGQAM
jgi:hypothetical protein